MPDPDPAPDAAIAAVRRFSRFYTRRIGLLHGGLLGGPLSLPEARLVYEIAQSGTSTAKALGAGLGLDSGYLSRLLRGLEEAGLILRRPSAEDGRQVLLSLTDAGNQVFAAMDARSAEEIGVMLERLPEAGRRRLVSALEEAEQLLGGAPPAPQPFILRPPRPGDMGWVVHRQAVLYAREYGFDTSFEALLAEIVAGFIRDFDPAREACWIAEHQGEAVGSVFLVNAGEGVAKLRMLYVEPTARGLGIGRRLVGECIATARALGYRRMTLWTNDILVAARGIYAAAGFSLISEEPVESFGARMVSEIWEREL
ncbi:MarR family transcriptional regulator [Rhodovarius crocodyli]|uniref:MarR family transcriptional regulator n=2 Tax=Rhodovarius crocodyli TaxID=1979269 RepID=A0A437M3Y1_9PROT|nr:MarR family transcriptional regulator [Rhodovarius crocodyli]